jgi:hypothetical protein
VLPAEGVPPHGHLGAAASRVIVDEAVRDLVLPGFEHVGVDARAARAWYARRAAIERR